MNSRFATILAVGLLTFSATACTPSSDPSPDPTGSPTEIGLPNAVQEKYPMGSDIPDAIEEGGIVTEGLEYDDQGNLIAGSVTLGGSGEPVAFTDSYKDFGEDGKIVPSQKVTEGHVSGAVAVANLFQQHIESKDWKAACGLMADPGDTEFCVMRVQEAYNGGREWVDFTPATIEVYVHQNGDMSAILKEPVQEDYQLTAYTQVGDTWKIR